MSLAHDSTWQWLYMGYMLCIGYMIQHPSTESLSIVFDFALPKVGQLSWSALLTSCIACADGSTTEHISDPVSVNRCTHHPTVRTMILFTLAYDTYEFHLLLIRLQQLCFLLHCCWFIYSSWTSRPKTCVFRSSVLYNLCSLRRACRSQSAIFFFFFHFWHWKC